jgi:hypothetical protein
MAWFSYNCKEHGTFRISLEKRLKEADCPVCGQKSPVILKPGTVRVTEILDNGAMVKRVERLHNVEEIMREREKKFKLKQKDEVEDADS